MDAHDDAVQEFETVVVGAGFAGIAAGVALKAAGRDDFVILDKGQDAGGTWRDNRYPGSRSQVPAHLYSYSFEPNPYWSRTYPAADEILDYLLYVVDNYGLREHLRTDTTVQDVIYDGDTATWMLTLASAWGSLSRVRAKNVVLGVGALHEPLVPELPGLEEFQGDLVHTATWNPSMTVRARRIGVIGTGASGVQIVPALAEDAAALSVFQRTAPWVLPLGDSEYPETTVDRFIQRPLLMKAHRATLRTAYEAKVPGPTTAGPVASAAAARANRLLDSQIQDHQLRSRLRPQDQIGVRPVVLSDDYYPTLLRDNVSLVTSAPVRADAGGIFTADGAYHRLDVLVLATGFDPIGSYRYLGVVGQDNRSLGHEWNYEVQTYLGLTIPHYPNLFLLGGPNTAVANSSSMLMLEAQVGLLMRLLAERDRRGARTVAVRPEIVPGFVAEIDRRSDRIGDARSWYTDQRGRNRSVWPGSARDYEKRLAKAEFVDYVFS